MRQVRTFYYEGLAAEDKPTGVKPTTIVKETDTGKTWITYDDGTTWICIDKRMRLVTEGGDFIELVAPLAAMEALKTYEFSINGVNFNGYSGIKTLLLEAIADDSHFVTLQDYNDVGVLEDYEVPEGSVFIAYQALIWMAGSSGIGKIGESINADGVASGGNGDGGISKEVLRFTNGTTLPFMTACYGVFRAGKFVTASGYNSTDMKAGSVLFGVERTI